jgi:hypothetical protein
MNQNALVKGSLLSLAIGLAILGQPLVQAALLAYEG